MQQPPLEKSCLNLEGSHIEQGHAMDIAPPIGRTSRPVYWSTILGSLLALVILVTAIAHGGVAVAAAIPPGLFINQTAGSLLVSGVDQQIAVSDNSVFVVTRINLLVGNQITATIKVDVPGFGRVVIRVSIAKLVIHNLYNTLAVPGTAPSSLVNIRIVVASVTIEGFSVTISRV